jgi:hypothetical protein
VWGSSRSIALGSLQHVGGREGGSEGRKGGREEEGNVERMSGVEGKEGQMKGEMWDRE